jgi:ribose/xylose/arabinose/galactoside ABC-type transport system permease subunit
MRNSNKKRAYILLLDNMVWLIVAAMMVWGVFFVPRFFTAKNIINIIFHSSVLSMLVLGEAICLMGGNFDLSIESTLGFSAMIAPMCFVHWIPGLPWWVGIFLVFSMGSVIGLINGLFIVKMGINPFLETLAMLIVLRGLNLYILPRSIYDIPAQYNYIGGAYWGSLPVSVPVMLLIFVFFWVVITQRRYGRHILAVGSNEIAARAAGINTGRVVISTFVISGFLASVGGFLLTGRMASVTNVMGEGMVFLAFAGAVLGGISLKGGEGSILGALGGVIVLGIIDNALQLLQVNVWFVYALKGILIFVAIIIDNTKRQLRTKILMGSGDSRKSFVSGDAA